MIQAYQRAVDLVPAPASAERARILAGLAAAHLLATNMRESRMWCERGLQVARAVGAEAEVGSLLCTLGTALCSLGDIEQAIAYGREALEIAARLDIVEDLTRAYANLSETLVMAGHFAEATRLARRGRDFATGAGTDHSFGAYLRGDVLDALYWSGEWDAAVSTLTGDAGAPAAHPRSWARQLLAEAAVLTGRGEFGRAERCLAVSREALAAGGDTNMLLILHVGLVEYHLTRGDPSTACAVLAGIADLMLVSENGLLVTRLAALAARAEADLASLSGTGATQAAVAQSAGTAGASGVDVAALIAELPTRISSPPMVAGQLAVARAELARIQRTDADVAWAEAAERWVGLGAPYPLAYARWREAKALMARRGGRRKAAIALGEANAIATRLAAAPLLADVEDLARRSRLELPAPRVEEPAPARRYPAFDLSPREEEVLGLIQEGHTNREIAKSLFISEKTVSIHVSRVLAKLRVANRASAVASAHRHDTRPHA